MKKSRFSDEQIAHALRQAEAGTPVAEIVRKLGVSEATLYAWKKRCGAMGTAEIRELRQLRYYRLRADYAAVNVPPPAQSIAA